ncbi:head maturation protease, ClpP-related [Erysipelothrix anatis]|uniref:head maturation protease, ClpP-related n=1 Tax=Erysipelothrix anatis TaxID=2683713 RepID=UPI00135C9912|nr:head maturation protease, ClpP-related [Erysipelothrix anatis]
MKQKSDVFQFVKENEMNTNIYVYGEIRKGDFWEKVFGPDETRVDAYSFKDLLASVETPKVTVRINSMGGSVSEGLAIYNQLNDFPGEVETIVDGFACSIASVIFMAGTKRVVPESSLVMIHNAWSSAVGDANAMRKAAELLEKVTTPSINIYQSKTGLDEDYIKSLMDNETWLTSKECFDLRFATAVERNDVKQSLDEQYLSKLILENKELRSQTGTSLTNEVNKTEIKSSWDGYFE